MNFPFQGQFIAYTSLQALQVKYAPTFTQKNQGIISYSVLDLKKPTTTKRLDLSGVQDKGDKRYNLLALLTPLGSGSATEMCADAIVKTSNTAVDVFTAKTPIFFFNLPLLSQFFFHNDW